MTHDQLAREFSELNGIEWHDLKFFCGQAYVCVCGETIHVYEPRFIDYIVSQHNSKNPQFSDAASILKVMMKRDDYPEFARVLCDRNGRRSKIDTYTIEVRFITEKDKLLKAAVEFCREHKK